MSSLSSCGLQLLINVDLTVLQEMYKHEKILEVNKLYSNDIHAISCTYGIEAACKVIIKVSGVPERQP